MTRKLSEEAHENYTQTLSSLKAKQQEEKHAWTTQHDALMNEITRLKYAFNVENIIIMLAYYQRQLIVVATNYLVSVCY